MSEKHGQLGAQWTKSAAPAAQASTSIPVPVPLSLPIPVPVPIQKANPTPYVNCNLQPADITYTAARFQAPVIHAKASPLTITPVGSGGAVPAGSQISPTSHTHVPVPVATPSGFVPPPFPNASAGATSVLTPNPFVSAAGNAAAAGLAFANAFSFNTAQQLGLGKIMHVMGGAPPAGSVPATTAPAVATAAASVPTIAGQRHPNEAVPATTGVINSTIAENVMNALTNSQAAGGAPVPSEEKMRRVQQVIESSLDDTAKLQIAQILERVSVLKPIEKLFLYLRLPGECADTDPLRQPQNPLGTRSEINHTINWVRSHLEHDAQVSIPKQDVYNDYIAYCERLSIKPLSTADFGKVMKQVFPGVRPRRLGTRGNSRYCYAAMRKTTKLTPPQLPQLNKNEKSLGDDPASDSSQLAASPNMVGLLPSAGGGGDAECWDVVRGWAEKLLNTKLESVADLSSRIRSNNATVSVKKYAPREPKEKRVLADIGPLKKRRKKKRKGSTSSESSCNQLATGQDAGSSQDASDEQLLKIKQEIIDSPIHHHQQQQQAPLPYLQQVTPMNLATDQRSSSAVRNLTPKIMEMGTPSVVLTQQEEPSPTGGLVIKDEVEDYTSNIFCKKVLKAQQTKGFWANSPSSGTTGGGGGLLVPPTITTTSATPPPPNTGNSPVPGPGLSMGPPSQMMIVNSVSPSSSVDTTPKVASRNQMMILRAKRLMAAENAALAAAAEDSGLPENLGLPRERVISICNMDKHELDDYFLPGEDEENSEEPDNELLQYFQMGDAEEKQLNSLDAAESNRNPQEPTSMGSAPEAMPAPGRGAPAAMLAPVPAPSLLPGQAGVGSASASLALMSKKHQQQQQQQQEKQQQHLQQQQQQLQRSKQLPTITNNNNKRKISLSNASSNGSNKNCIFLPISPNINGSNGAVASTPTAASVSAPANSSQNCFASPGVTRMKQRSSLLSKQQSLDCDNRDPMIGAHRKGRGYVYSYPTSTSASAPPSPSLLQQWMGASWSFSSGGNACSFADSSHSADPLVNQNSMDLETSLALTGANDLDPAEMQRSQSVPLSQLQRRCSQQSPSLNFYSENSNSQQSAPLKDTGLLYDDVDVSSLISPSFNHKFNSMTQQTATTCSSSAGSSSGYSSGGSAGIVSRSVPSTPLPHQQQNCLTSMNGGAATANGAGAGGAGTGNGASCGVGNGFFNISPSFNWGGSSSSGNGNHVAYGPHSYGARNPLDISKSMPTTPIANQCFRYSPAEMPRDFLINGNTIDSLPSSSAFGAGGVATDPGLALSTDTLIDDSAPSSADVVEAMIGVEDILDDF